jgi:hypothetical protein
MKTAVRVTFAALALLASHGALHAAGQPERFTFEVDRTITDTQLCGFPIVARDEGTVRLAFHFDKQGAIEWVNVTTSNYRITIENPETGVSLWTPSPEHILETAFDTTNTGLVIRFVLPGAGLLTLDAGRVVFENDGDVRIDGPHMFLEGDVEALCAALAGGA